jgi:hypothetical protein
MIFEWEHDKEVINTGIHLLMNEFLLVKDKPWSETKDSPIGLDIRINTSDKVGTLLLDVYFKHTIESNYLEMRGFGGQFSGFPGCCGIAVFHDGYKVKPLRLRDRRGYPWGAKPALPPIELALKPGFWKAFTSWALEFVKECNYTYLLAVDSDEKALSKTTGIAKDLGFKTIDTFVNGKTSNLCHIFGIDTGFEYSDEDYEDDE